MHDEHQHLLEWKLRMLDLVVDHATMLIADTTTPVVAFVLAAVAGFSQLFSP